MLFFTFFTIMFRFMCPFAYSHFIPIVKPHNKTFAWIMYTFYIICQNVEGQVSYK